MRVRTGLPVPHLVDVDWRLDYVVKSSVAGAVNQPLYIVKLTTTNTGSPRTCHLGFLFALVIVVSSVP